LSYQEEGNKRPFRILADHIRAITFLLAAGVFPSNKAQGYVLRRLIRRAVVQKYKHGKKLRSVSCLVGRVVEVYKVVYPKIEDALKARDILDREEEGFMSTLERAISQWEKIENPGEEDVFNFVTSYGLPLEIIQEELGWKGDFGKVKDLLAHHKELSRTASKGMFKGGLAGQSEKIKRLHTATHLLHQALRIILGEHVLQMGSNITEQRLRFDFSHPRKMTEKELAMVENLVNGKIKEGLAVEREEMSLEQALESGALALFRARYPSRVSVYTIKDKKGKVFSKEICLGPHVMNTSELGCFRIEKEESLGRGTRRIKAVLE